MAADNPLYFFDQHNHHQEDRQTQSLTVAELGMNRSYEILRKSLRDEEEQKAKKKTRKLTLKRLFSPSSSSLSSSSSLNKQKQPPKKKESFSFESPDDFLADRGEGGELMLKEARLLSLVKSASLSSYNEASFLETFEVSVVSSPGVPGRWPKYLKELLISKSKNTLNFLFSNFNDCLKNRSNLDLQVLIFASPEERTPDGLFPDPKKVLCLYLQGNPEKKKKKNWKTISLSDYDNNDVRIATEIGKSALYILTRRFYILTPEKLSVIKPNRVIILLLKDTVQNGAQVRVVIGETLITEIDWLGSTLLGFDFQITDALQDEIDVELSIDGMSLGVARIEIEPPLFEMENFIKAFEQQNGWSSATHSEVTRLLVSLSKLLETDHQNGQKQHVYDYPNLGVKSTSHYSVPRDCRYVPMQPKPQSRQEVLEKYCEKESEVQYYQNVKEPANDGKAVEYENVSGPQDDYDVPRRLQVEEEKIIRNCNIGVYENVDLHSEGRNLQN